MEGNTSFLASMLQISPGGILAGLVAAAVLYKAMFKDFSSFAESVKFWFFMNSHRSGGEMFSEEWWAETKVFVWLGLSAAIAYGTHTMLAG